MWRNWQTRMVEGHVILDRGGSNPFIRTTTKTPERVFFCCGADKVGIKTTTLFRRAVRFTNRTSLHSFSWESLTQDLLANRRRPCGLVSWARASKFYEIRSGPIFYRRRCNLYFYIKFVRKN